MTLAAFFLTLLALDMACRYPWHCDRVLLPSHATCKENARLAWACHEGTSVWCAGWKESRRLYDCWDHARMATDPNGKSVRYNLHQYQLVVGWRAFYTRDYPPTVPFWLFRKTEKEN